MQPVPVGPGDAAATRPDGDQFDRRQRHRQAVIEERPGVFFQGVAVDQPDIEAGAAHIGGNNLFVAKLVAQKARRDQPADGAGIHDGDRLFSDIRGPRGTAGGRDDLYRVRESVGRQATIQIADVFLCQRADIGVDNGGHGAFELAHFRGDLMRQADRNAGCDVCAYRRYTFFMSRIAECPEQADSKAFSTIRDEILDRGP